ncbi:hypothetical protein ACFY94_07705 [Streptomyces griseorubiginosus]|uniref:hypothetical protein n=1 Tax=Streptomyces griseorubiginosus TaxID=67304 RepID=UPI0036E14B15
MVSPGIGSPTSGATEKTTRARSRAWSSASLVMFSSYLTAASEKGDAGAVLAGHQGDGRPLAGEVLR